MSRKHIIATSPWSFRLRRPGVLIPMLVGCCVSLVAVVHADVPRTIHYQGKLTEPDGTPFVGEHTVTVRLYDAQTGGTQLWQEQHALNLLRQDNGILSLALGSVTPFGSTVNFNAPLWLSIEVDGGGELSPRQRLAAVAYAINADLLDGLDSTQLLAGSGGGDITAVNAGIGLAGGAASGDATIDVGAGTGIVVGADSVSIDVGTTAGKIVQLDGSGALPVVSGANLTALNASNLTSGTLSDARLSSNVSLLGSSIESSEVTDDTLIAADTAPTFLAAGAGISVSRAGGSWSISASGGGGTITGVTAGAGLTGGGTSGTVALDVGAGAGIAVNADDLTLDATTTGTTSTTSANSGLEVTAAGLRVLGGCADGELLKWTAATSVWSCAADADTNSGGTVTSITAGTGLTGGTITTSGTIALATPVAIANGGTGATTASAARTSLGAAASGANSDITALSGLTTALSVGQGGTGATTASGARTSLGAAANGANSDITSLGGLTTPLSAGQGGTGIGSYASGELLYASGVGTLSQLPIGTASQVLKVSGGLPAWSADADSGGTVTSISQGTGISATPNPLTTSGTISLDQSVAPTWTGAHSFSKANAAGAGATAVTINSALAAMDAVGGDTFRGLSISLTNANHTGGSVVGLNVSGLSGDPDAAEYAVSIGAGWDRALSITGADVFTLGASDSVQIDGATTATTTTGGALDLDVSSATNAANGLNLSFTTSGSTSAATNYAERVSLVQSPTTNARTLYGLDIAATDAGTLANTLIGLHVNAATANANDTAYAAVLEGGNVGIGTTAPGATLDVKGTVRLSGPSSGFVGLAPAAAAGSTTYTLPTADGSSGQFLQTDGSGALVWATPSGSGGTVTSITAGTGLTGGTITTSGTIALATPVAIANGGTGATTAAAARTNLGTAASGANGDITSLTGLTTALTITQGGTGATTASGARTNLGLGSLATQDASGVAITGGTIDGAVVGGTAAAAGTFTSLTATTSISLPANSVTDAMVSDTLTASKLVGTGSTSDAVDLGTAEVAGSLGDSSVADDLTITSTKNGSFSGTAITGDVLSVSGGGLTSGTLYKGVVPSSGFSGSLVKITDNAGSPATKFEVSAAGAITTGSIAASGITGTLADAQVSDTLTASILKGSGSTSDAVDLATAEVSGILAIANGGTGATTAAAARTNLGTAASGANGDITSLSGLTTALSIGQGGTGSTTASGARTSLGAAASGANSDITSLSGLTTALSVAQGGTGATTITNGALVIGRGTSAIATTGVLAKGSLIVGDGATDPTFLSVGGDNTMLMADSTRASGVKWATGCMPIGGTDETSRSASFQMGAFGLSSTTGRWDQLWPAPVAGTITNLRAFVNAAPGAAGDSWTVTVRKNDANTTQACTISGSGQSCASAGASVSVAAGDRIGVEFIEGGSAAGTTGEGWGACFVPN